MSHDTLNLGGVALPGGGTVLVHDTSPGGIVPRVEIRTNAHPPEMDPAAAGGLADLLLEWAIARGYMPRPTLQWDRWQLPDPEVFAVLVERALIGEDPTVENYQRYAAAHRDAARIAAALPEVLALLEQYQAGLEVDAEIVEADEEPATRTLRLTWHPDAVAKALRYLTEYRDEQCPAPFHDGDTIAIAIDALRQVVGSDGCGPDCSEGHTYAPPCEQAITGDAEPMARYGVTLPPGAVPWPKVSDLRTVLDALGQILEMADRGESGRFEVADEVRAAHQVLRVSVDSLGALSSADVGLHDLLDRYPGADGPASHAGVHPSEVPFCAGRSSAAHDRRAMNLGPSGWVCATCGEVDPLERDGDPVEDEDGAPLPESVQALLRAAQTVTECELPAMLTYEPLVAAVGGMRILLERVLSESRR